MIIKIPEILILTWNITDLETTLKNLSETLKNKHEFRLQLYLTIYTTI